MMSRIIFHHIDKCAGTTLLKYLQNLFTPSESLLAEDYVNAHTYGIEHFDDNVLARTKFVHDPFGVLSWLDRLANARAFTFLRDPFDRIVSNWWMVNRWTDAEVENFPDGAFARSLSRSDPAAFFCSENPHIRSLNWNRITKHLACAPDVYRKTWLANDLDDPAFRSFMLQRAEDHLRSLSFIGFQEDFDRSLLCLQLWLSLPPDRPQSLNVHRSRQQRPKLDALAVNAAQRMIDLDEKIVSIARDLYEEQLDRFTTEFGSDFHSAALKVYDELNGRQTRWHVIDASQPLNGTGWHCREINGTKFSRWIGPAPLATVNIPFQKDRGAFIRFRVTNILSATQVDLLRISVDGKNVDLHRWQESTFVVCFDAIVSAQDLKQSDKLIRVAIDCHETIFPKDENDDRRLGLEICEIEVGPKDSLKLQEHGTPEKIRGRLGEIAR